MIYAPAGVTGLQLNHGVISNKEMSIIGGPILNQSLLLQHGVIRVELTGSSHTGGLSETMVEEGDGGTHV